MENDVVFQYIKLFLDHFWIVLVLGALCWVYLNPKFLDRIGSFRAGDFEVEFRELKDQVILLKNENARLTEVVAGLDLGGPKQRLEESRRTLKPLASRLEANELDRLYSVFDRSDFDPKDLYAAAIVARARRDPAIFGKLVTYLSKIAKDRDLKGVRLKIVWTLVSAVHLTLKSELSGTSSTQLTQKDMELASSMLTLLAANERVKNDRPDNPSRGVLGPIRYAQNLINTGPARNKL